MDEDIRAALTDLKTDLKGGFEKVDQTFKEMVTKGEFNATVQRIDAEQASLRRDLDSHEKAAPEHRKAAMDRADSVRAEVKTELDGFKSTTRWAITLAATGAGLVVAGAQWLLSI